MKSLLLEASAPELVWTHRAENSAEIQLQLRAASVETVLSEIQPETVFHSINVVARIQTVVVWLLLDKL